MLRFLVLLVLLVAAPFVPHSYAQRPAGQPELPRDLATGMVSYRRVVVLESLSREELYYRVRAWVRQHHHAPAGTEPQEDWELGQILVQGQDTIAVRGKLTAVVRHTLKLQVRNGRVQYEFTNFSAQPFGAFENDHPAQSRRAWNTLRTNTDIEVKNWVSSLEKALAAKEKTVSGL